MKNYKPWGRTTRVATPAVEYTYTTSTIFNSHQLYWLAFGKAAFVVCFILSLEAGSGNEAKADLSPTILLPESPKH